MVIAACPSQVQTSLDKDNGEEQNIAQAVSRWLHTAAARVRVVVDKVALGQVFSEYFGFPCQSSFHQLLHTHQYHLGQV
jgi:hypothetical protein